MKKKTIIIMASVIFTLLLIIVVLLVTGGKKEVTIIFDTNGGNEIASVKIKKGSKTTLPTPKKDESVFDGWYIGNNVIDEKYEFTKDITLKAHWKDKEEKETFIVTFDTDGGNEIESIEIKCGEGIKLPKEPIKKGYTFIAWEDDDLKTIHDNDKLACEDTTLKANWDKEDDLEETSKLTIYFDSKGGSEVKSIRMYCKDSVPALPTPTKEGYIFQNWKSKSGKIIKEGDKISCDRITVYAVWKIDPNALKYYTVTFDSKGGSAVESIKVECDKELKLPTSPTKEGYEFVAWQDKNGKAILDGAKLTCEDIKLTADWKEKEKEKPTCTEGKLEGDKCIIEKDPEKVCPDGYGYSETLSKCYKYTSNATITCKAAHGFETGDKYDDTHGHLGCAYQDMASYPTEETCHNAGGTYYTYLPKGHCYKYVDAGTTNFNYTCPNGQSYETSTTLGGTQNSGCYTLTTKTDSCKNYSGFELKDGKCVKTVDAQ